MQKLLDGVSTFPSLDAGVFVLLGRPGSGKTTLTSSILLGTSGFAGKYDFYLIISPSRMPGIDYDDAFHSSILNLAWLAERISTIGSIIVNSTEKKTYSLAIVFDDCIQAVKKASESQLLSKLFFNYRHIIPNCKVTVIVISQQFTKIPTMARATVSAFILLKQGNKDLEDFRKECTSFSKRDWSDITSEYLSINATGHPFILFEMETMKMFNQKGKEIVTNPDLVNFISTQKQPTQESLFVRERTPPKVAQTKNEFFQTKKINLDDFFK